MLTVTLNPPDIQNRIDVALAAELKEACQAATEDQRIRLVIVTSSGPVFSVGREPMPPDIRSGPVESRKRWLQQLQVASAIASIPLPVLVAINGDALDHGLEVALAGDLRIAVQDAHLGLRDLTEGGFPWDGAIQRLLRLIGPAWAQDLVLTSRTIDASQAQALGLVNRVVSGDRLLPETRELAGQIIAAAPLAARYAKEAVQKGLDLSLHQGLSLEADLNTILQSTSDRGEGIRSFLERRLPRFNVE